MQQPKISLQEAVSTAMNMVRDLYKEQGYELNDLLLEEVDLKPNGIWEVTVGFTRPGTSSGISTAIAGARRAFKKIRIDAETGDFMSMEIRELRSSPPPQ